LVWKEEEEGKKCLTAPFETRLHLCKKLRTAFLLAEPFFAAGGVLQGCQTILRTIYQNGEIYTTLPQNIPKYIKRQ
jgi:hypothetical protein